jgi:hypothetical protein
MTNRHSVAGLDVLGMRSPEALDPAALLLTRQGGAGIFSEAMKELASQKPDPEKSESSRRLVYSMFYGR